MLENKQKSGQDGAKSSFQRGMLDLCARRFVLEMIKVMDIRNIWFFYFLRC